MSGRVGVAALMALLAGATACFPEEPIGPRADVIVVEGVLDLAASRQLISVRSQGGTHALSGTLVTVTGPDGAIFTGVEDRTRQGVYSVTTGNALRPGSTYDLKVVLSDGREVTASTRVPNRTPVRPPSDTVYEPFDPETDTLRLSWARGSAAAFWVHVYSSDGFENVSLNDREYSFFAENSVTLAGTARTPFGDPVFDGRLATVTVAAVDENFHEYYRARIDPFAPASPSRLNGAAGVFGAIVPIIVHRYGIVNGGPDGRVP